MIRCELKRTERRDGNERQHCESGLLLYHEMQSGGQEPEAGPINAAGCYYTSADHSTRKLRNQRAGHVPVARLGDARASAPGNGLRPSPPAPPGDRCSPAAAAAPPPAPKPLLLMGMLCAASSACAEGQLLLQNGLQDRATTRKG